MPTLVESFNGSFAINISATMGAVETPALVICAFQWLIRHKHLCNGTGLRGGRLPIMVSMAHSP